MALAASLGLAEVHPFGDAGLYANEGAVPVVMERTAVPLPVREMLVAKCADCHSMQTRTPVYGRFAPVCWMLEQHVIKARQSMNLALWDRYPVERQQDLAARMVQARTGKMPLPSYRWAHLKAGLNADEAAMLAAWARSLQGGEGVSQAEGTGDSNFCGADKLKGYGISLRKSDSRRFFAVF